MKKTLLFNILFFSFLICIKTYSQQQILVQKEWLASSGSIDTIPYSATAINSQNQVIVLGNTINAGQLNNILLTKYNQSGTILWEQQINGTDNGKDFGTALFIDSLDNIYIAGVVYSSTTNFDYLIAKYSNSGSPIWTKLFNGIANSNDIPIAIAVKNNFCYVTGSSIGNGTLTDFATLQLNITNGDINWVKTYNYSNGYEIPVGIVINPNGNVFVTGASASSLNNWDITTIEYDTLGQEINVNRSESVSNGFDKPFDIKKDYQGNIYVVGRTIAPNNTYDIKLLKFNSSFTLQWTTTFNGIGGNDEPSKMTIDLQGNVIIAGYTLEGGKKKFLVLKYDSLGNLMWQKSENFSNYQNSNYATNIATMLNGSITVTGATETGNNANVVTVNYSAEGEENWREFFADSANNNVTTLSTDSIGNVFINTTVKNNNILQNGIIKYATLKKEYKNVLSNTGKPLFSNNQFIIRFGSHVVNKQAIDNSGKPQDALFGKLERFVNAETAEQIKNALDIREDIHLIKIFPYDLSTDTTDISNNGNPLRVPEFYCTFLMLLPDSCNIFQKMEALEPLFPKVIFTEPDYFVEGEEGFNSGTPEIISTSNCYDNLAVSYSLVDTTSGINLFPALAKTRGKQHVRVGVFDSGLQWYRSEFQKFDEVPNQGDTATSHVYGYDFLNETNLKIPSPIPGGGGYHGTAVAAIIAANNGNGGMMGVAGGCSMEGSDDPFWSGPQYNGIRMYGAKIYESGGFDFIPNPISHIANSIKNTSKRNNLQGYDFEYQLNIQNHSWKILAQANNAFFTPTNTQLLTEALHYVNRLGVTFVASRGNEGNSSYQMPACPDTTWVLCVGGTGNDGNYMPLLVTPDSTYAGSSYGPQVDVAAPASQITLTVGMQNPYAYFSGTSAAAPHVTGVAALLMSYMNNPNDPLDENNLAPEDIEWILKHSATDVGTSGSDIYSGAGRLNAGAALQMVEKPYRKLYHFRSSSGILNNFYLVDNNRTVYLKEPYHVNGSNYSNVGTYLVDIFAYEKEVPFELDSASTIVGIWPLHSQSGLFGLPINDTLDLHQRVEIVSYTQNSATVRSYFYLIKNNQGDTIGNWPSEYEDNFDIMSFSVLGNNYLLQSKKIKMISQLGNFIQTQLQIFQL